MEEDGELGLEGGASWRKDSMNCWIWRFSRRWSGCSECAKTGMEWSGLGLRRSEYELYVGTWEALLPSCPLDSALEEGGIGGRSLRTAGKCVLRASTARIMAPFRIWLRIAALSLAP